MSRLIVVDLPASGGGEGAGSLEVSSTAPFPPSRTSAVGPQQHEDLALEHVNVDAVYSNLDACESR